MCESLTLRVGWSQLPLAMLDPPPYPVWFQPSLIVIMALQAVLPGFVAGLHAERFAWALGAMVGLLAPLFNVALEPQLHYNAGGEFEINLLVATLIGSSITGAVGGVAGAAVGPRHAFLGMRASSGPQSPSAPRDGPGV